MQPITHLSSITHDYDALLLDLWGVVHDGSALYPGVIETLTELRARDKKIIFLSNAPRRAAKAAAVLTQLGVHSALYDHVVTSGEVGYEWLSTFSPAGGGTYYYIGPPKDEDILDGLSLARADDPTKADFLLNVGFGSEARALVDLAELLRAAAARGQPMICLNPDMEVVKITGERFPCAGVIAREYEQLGGHVRYFGKPYPEVYERCMALLNSFPRRGRVGEGAGLEDNDFGAQQECPPPNLPPGGGGIRILAVGDGIATDIAGATRFGLDSLFIRGGIATELSSEAIEAQLRAHSACPRYVMDRLAW